MPIKTDRADSLIPWLSSSNTNLSPQIGNRFAVTAAHCLYDDDNTELLPASSFSIMLGLHDRRRKTKEPNRWLFHHEITDQDLHYVPGDRSGSARLLSMKTSMPLSMTLLC